MPTSVVNWRGILKNRKAQRELVEKLSIIGNISSKAYKDFFDMEAKASLFDEDETLLTLLLSKFIFPPELNINNLEKVDEKFYLIRNIQAYGRGIPIFDARRFNSLGMIAHSYEIGFIFLRCDDPLLNGRIVHIQDVNPEHSFYKISTKVALIPEFDLRYYFEYWTRELFGWIKLFYIPSLDYSIGYLSNPQEWEYEKIQPDDTTAKERIFRKLCRKYKAEIKKNIQAQLEYQAGEETQTNQSTN